jgi:hypothetical protein
MIRELAIWDVFNEHCSYFTPRSLWWALATADLRVLALEEAFDGQYLSAEAAAGLYAGVWPPEVGAEENPSGFRPTGSSETAHSSACLRDIG